MRILYLSPGCFDKGGISRYNRYQIQTLRELFGDGFIRVISLAGHAPGDFEVPFEVHWSGKGPTLISKIKFVCMMVYQVLFWRPQIILVAHVNFSGLAVLASLACGAKVVLNTYGLEVWSPLTRLSDWGLRHCDEVIADCHFTAEFLEHAGYRSKKSVVVIWDCVDLRRFSVGPVRDKDILKLYGIPDPTKFKLIVILGRISKAASHKGYDRLIKVFAKIHQSYSDARLVLAGKGDWVDDLKKWVDELRLSDKIIFTGMVEEQHLVDIYRSAYVFSLVSDRGVGRGEGIPLTPLEAMACGVPIIVGNHDGSQEAVVDQRNGYVIDPFDLDAHADKLSSLLADQALRNEKGREAMLVANQYFSYESFKEKHRQFLDRIVKSET